MKRRVRSLFVVLILLAIVAFGLSPYRLGTVKEYRALVYLKYWGVIQPKTVNPETLAQNLSSSDLRVQTEAAQSIGLLPRDPHTVTALRQFIDRPSVEAAAKDVAIWSLGELHVEDALPQLRTRVGRADCDQGNLERAIAKIEGRVRRSIWPE
jgi:hypothetical protein